MEEKRTESGKQCDQPVRYLQSQGLWCQVAPQQAGVAGDCSGQQARSLGEVGGLGAGAAPQALILGQLVLGLHQSPETVGV